jgi:hypothetical protein
MEQEIETVEFGFKEKVLQYYFLNRSKVHAWAGGGVAVCVVAIAYLSAGPTDSDYTKACVAFEEWKDTPADGMKSSKMRKSLKRVPGLERALEAEIVQTYLAQGLITKAEKIAYPALKRLAEVSPLHAGFGEATLWIEQGDYQKGLELAVGLKERMEQTLDSRLWKGNRMGGGSALYVCNLLRIAFLQKQLKNGPGELAAWEELKGLIEVEGESSAAAQLLQANFGAQKFTLTDFISQRERSIVH